VPILLDTNVYLLALRSENGAAFFANRFLPLVFQTYLAGVVVEELYAGALDGEAVHLVERYVGALERAGRVVAPNFQDWKDAGKIIAGITRREPALKSKAQQVLNDILLALSARRIVADLYTFNRADFELIRRHSSFLLRFSSAERPTLV
jgi:predicted nucleic acid-binding protein